MACTFSISHVLKMEICEVIHVDLHNGKSENLLDGERLGIVAVQSDRCVCTQITES